MVYEGKFKLGDYFQSRRERGKPGLPVLSVTLRNGLVKRDSIDRKTDSNLDPEQHLLVRKGDIVYNMMRMWQGASGLAHCDGIVSPAYIVLSPKDNIDSLFASYLFKSPRMIHLFWAYSFGLTRDRLRLYFGDFKSIPVDIPSKEEQVKAARILSTWDKAIETVEELIENSRQQKKALMQQLLKGRVRFPEIRKPWVAVDFSEIAEINPGKPNRPKDGYVSFVSMNDVSEEAQLLSTGVRQYSDVDSGFTAFKDYDVLVAKITPCFENGKGAYVQRLRNGIGFGSTEFHVLRAREYTDPRLIYYLTNAREFRIRGEANMQGSAGQKRVPTDYIKNYRVRVPSDPREQTKISDALTAADNDVKNLRKQLKRLLLEKQALMQKLLTGEWRVASEFQGQEVAIA